MNNLSQYLPQLLWFPNIGFKVLRRLFAPKLLTQTFTIKHVGRAAHVYSSGLALKCQEIYYVSEDLFQ